jgi:hypothetical protein
MGTVVHQSGDRRTSVNYYEALNQHPVGSNRLPRMLMAAFARQDSIRVFGDLIIHLFYFAGELRIGLSTGLFQGFATVKRLILEVHSSARFGILDIDGVMADESGLR